MIGWDAADWQVINPLLDSGQMPFLERLITGGVMGNIATLEPSLSPMLWTSIATGKRADQHGVLGFVEPLPDGKGIRPVSGTSRKVKAVWNILMQRGLRSNVVGWWPSHPAEPLSGACVSNRFQSAIGPLSKPWPMPAGTVYPPRLADTLAEFRLHPGELTEDELRMFVPDAAKVDQDSDPRLAMLAKILAECTSVHAAATWLMQHEPWDFTAVYYDAIDHFCHGFMQFHPPRRPHVPEELFELYKDVVNSAYRYHDLMLGRLLQLAGEEATVILVSDHGFHSGEQRPLLARGRGRPGPAAWHRPFGIVCMQGPHIRQDERIYGASLLDIAPTILTLFGLPVGRDMDGRPLMQAFDKTGHSERIGSWEQEPGPSGMHPPDEHDDPWEAQETLQQLVALGYIEPPSGDSERTIRRVLQDREFNLARVYLEQGKFDAAADVLERLVQAAPDDPNFILRLAYCRFHLGQPAECRRLAEMVIAMSDTMPVDALPPDDAEGRPRLSTAVADFLLGCVCFGEDNDEEALEHLLRAQRAQPRLPNLHNQVGAVYLRQRRFAEAERAFRTGLAIDGDSPVAHDGLAQVCLATSRYEAAADEALSAVGLLHHFPDAHYHLGLALIECDQLQRAQLAFETCLRMRPGHAGATQKLHDVVALLKQRER